MSAKGKRELAAGFAHLVVVFIAVALLVGGVIFAVTSKGSGKGLSSVLHLKKTPYQELTVAMDKTIAAKTAYIDYKTKITSRVTIAANGVTQTLENNVDGFINGTLDMKSDKAEMRIYVSGSPAQSVTISSIDLPNGDTYVKSSILGPKWKKYTKDDNSKMKGSDPTDASLYGFQFLETMLSSSKGLMTNKDAVMKLPDVTESGKTLSKYSIEVPLMQFVDALGKDSEKTDKDKEDAKKILADGTVKATYYVDGSTGYVTRVFIEAKNLTQIPTKESIKVGATVKHDIEMTAELSRFGVAVEVAAPDEKEVAK